MKKLLFWVIVLFSVVAFLPAQQLTDVEKIVEGEAIIVIGNQTMEVGRTNGPRTESYELEHGSILIVKDVINFHSSFERGRDKFPWTENLFVFYENPKLSKAFYLNYLIIHPDDFLRMRQEFRKVEKNLEQYRKIEEEQRLILKFFK